MAKGKQDCCGEKLHPDHATELSRLNRVAGQVEGVKRMISERRYCQEILTQLRAIRAALHAIEGNILDTHLGRCVADTFAASSDAEKQKKMAELKELYRRYGD
jgi:DNA-binding FrmR family transcriptional regulator